jgi:hypothetical protein
MKTLKNWWFAFAGMLLVILDQGFEVLNPFLIEIGLPEKWIGLVKLLFGIYGMYKLKTSLPSQNPDTMQEKIQKLIGTPNVPKTK